MIARGLVKRKTGAAFVLVMGALLAPPPGLAPKRFGLPATAQEASPMAAPSFPVDDEPEGTPEETAVLPITTSVYPTTGLPLPPLRPWSEGEARAPAIGRLAPLPYPVLAMPLPPPRRDAELRPPPVEVEKIADPAAEPAPPAKEAPSGFAGLIAWPRFFSQAGNGPEIELAPDTRIASLPAVRQPSTTEEIEAEEEQTPEPMLVEKQTEDVNIACLTPELMRFVRQAGEHFGGTPVITSGHRDRGRRGSYHRRCMAADFFVPGVQRAALARYLRSLPGAGGVGTYCHTKSVHIDTGEPRNWYQCKRRFRFAQR